MLTPVNFNNQIFFKTHEVYNIVAYRFLSPKLQTFNLFSPQVLP